MMPDDTDLDDLQDDLAAEEAQAAPIDPATGQPYKSGEVPLGRNEPVP